ncbi:DUF4190 domain-containing protein [Corynebacterium breve]|uniref:DUF4190 domain-containing protein n=1 Tax=Corynebacterium breve TaxID=3049799 RepID=A0ABY8VDQ7_9CORY|nr:DUF4190 domain-containing protein [Corynebacterium breve]WIM66758.1 DUF4190 domain-containing protein [Corynebacterium breve]
MTDNSNQNNPFGNNQPDNGPYNNPGGDSAQGGTDYTSSYPQSGPTDGAGSSSSYSDQTGYSAQESYPNQGGYQAGQPVEKNNLALWSLILGIVGIVLVITIFLFPVGTLAAIIGLILGIMGIRRANKITGPVTRKGMAIGGVVTSIIALVMTVGLLFLGVGMMSFYQESGMKDCEHLLDSPDEYEQCVQDVIENANQ